MKKILVLVSLIILFAFAGNVRAANGTVETSISIGANVTLDFFYEPLRPYGEWIYLRSCGWVWAPYDIGINWRPYSNGRWIYTDWGWTWASSEPWGWACYHYGRWFSDTNYGWVWCPDNVWGPAWVSWRTGPGWIGWTPLPPGIPWKRRLFGRHHNFETRMRPSDYCFVRDRDFLSDNIEGRIVSPSRNVTIVKQTNVIFNYREKGKRIINDGPPKEQVERINGRPIRSVRIDETDRPGREQVKNDRVSFYKPDLIRTKRPVQAPRVKPDISAPQRKEIIDKQQNDMKILEQYQNEQRRILENRQKAEKENPPGKVTREILNRRHAEENAAFNEQKIRERRQVNTWQKLERQTTSTQENYPPSRYNLKNQLRDSSGSGRSRNQDRGNTQGDRKGRNQDRGGNQRIGGGRR